MNNQEKESVMEVNGMSYDQPKRETTLQEEIEGLEVSQNVKARLLQKLKEECYKIQKLKEEKEVIAEEMYDIRKQNISLKKACVALAVALKRE